MAEPLLDFNDIRLQARKLAERRREARVNYERHAVDAADAECEYHQSKAVAFAKARSGEKGVGESEIIANGESAPARHKRDLAQAQAKAALLRIDELEADRAMLRQLGDWSQRLEDG